MRLLAVFLTLSLGACASLPPAAHHLYESKDADVIRCAELYRTWDAAVFKAGVNDGSEARVAGYPHLRATRFLESLKLQLTDASSWDQWLTLLRETDLNARRFELMNLPARDAPGPGVIQQLDACGAQMAKLDGANEVQRERVRQAVKVSSDYRTWRRAVGLYALTRIPFAAGVRGYQKETEDVFRTPPDQLHVIGDLVRYDRVASQDAMDGPAVLNTNNALHVPAVTAPELKRLFDQHAPIFEIDEAGDYDRIGGMRWNGKLTVDSDRPTLYQRATFTRYGDRNLLQLVYGVWFSARPKKGFFDLLGGDFDGILWRVTLDERGRVLLYDSIHQCGCYHQFFPTVRVHLRSRPDSLDEYAFVPQSLPALERGQRVRIRVASGTHYLQRVTVVSEGGAASARIYTVLDDDELRSLPKSDGRRSAFSSDGMVAGSERGERFFFWPMGVPNAGAMRQYGRHATAFIGRRHFDDSNLIERYFVVDENK